MTDRELAEKIVAFGVGSSSGDLYSLDGFSYDSQKEQGFVRDWRVAGAMIEKCLDEGFVFDIGQKVRILSTEIAISISESLPRAINEACVEALSTDGEGQEFGN